MINLSHRARVIRRSGHKMATSRLYPFGIHRHFLPVWSVSILPSPGYKEACETSHLCLHLTLHVRRSSFVSLPSPSIRWAGRKMASCKLFSIARFLGEHHKLLQGIDAVYCTRDGFHVVRVFGSILMDAASGKPRFHLIVRVLSLLHAQAPPNVSVVSE